MAKFSDIIKLFVCDSKIKLARAMEFRLNFIMGFIFGVVGSGIIVFNQYFLYSKTKGYPGWSFDQVLLFQAVMFVITGLRDTMFGNVRPIFEAEVQTGGLDRILLYPFSSLGVILAKGFQFNTIHTIFAGLALLILSIYRLNITLHWWHIALFIMFLIIGLILYAAFLIFYCAITIRLIYMDKIREIFDQIVNFGTNPVEVFPGLIRLIYLTMIPIAVFIYFPSQALLGRLNPICIYGAGISFILLFVSIKFWKIQLTKYSSAGG